MRGRGFTLVEICITLIIMGVLLAVAVPNFGSFYEGSALKKAADDVAFLMRYAQGKAVAEGAAYRLATDAEFQHYWIERAAIDEEGKPKEFQHLPSAMGRVFKIHALVHARLEGESVGFFPDGTMTKALVILAGTKSQWVVSTQAQRGYVTVYEEDNETAGISSH